ncbi:histone-fold-containing protein [Paraphoma chrysanthemicola]|uniref:DNA polymerase epsilon subunit D n=1 Tax=Paraphoma chrysanthemicola TaxID=798071 RepID=A0A8K0W5F4_9PLEO|nr:histone-fold-containing protein [Paraphoma chrysanthemicola]
MPPRKSNVSVAAAEEEIPLPKSASKEPKDDALSVEDLNLPKSIVQRLAKGVLPPNTQIQKDALLAMSKSATVYVNYITSCAAEHAQRQGKKTVMPQDVFAAMHELEFSFMLPRLEAEVTKFTSIQADKRNTYRKKVREVKKAQKEGGGVAGEENSMVSGVGGAQDGDSPPKAKRARLDGEAGEGSEDEGEGDTVDVEGEGDAEEDEEVEDDEIEEEDEGEGQEGLTEDLLEEREDKEEDDEMGDGDESD